MGRIRAAEAKGFILCIGLGLNLAPLGIQDEYAGSSDVRETSGYSY